MSGITSGFDIDYDYIYIVTPVIGGLLIAFAVCLYCSRFHRSQRGRSFFGRAPPDSTNLRRDNRSSEFSLPSNSQRQILVGTEDQYGIGPGVDYRYFSPSSPFLSAQVTKQMCICNCMNASVSEAMHFFLVYKIKVLPVEEVEELS